VSVGAVSAGSVSVWARSARVSCSVTSGGIASGTSLHDRRPALTVAVASAIARYARRHTGSSATRRAISAAMGPSRAPPT
jgi:hypothetical protein